MVLGVIFAAVLVVIFAYGVYEALGFPLLAQVFPFWISLVTLALTLAQFVIEIRKYRLRLEEAHADFVDLAPDRSLLPEVIYGRALRYLLWIVGLYACIWIAGFVIAITAFLLTFLRWEARLNWDDVLYLAAGGFLFVVGISWIMTLYWPEGLIGQWLELPWPLA
jgi:putative tricarboxylic transport membrane protein